jgi:hypothetical protein
MKALTQAGLDILFSGGCAVPHCECHGKAPEEGLYVNQLCHPKASVEARYQRKTGILFLECSECEQLVVAIQVAKP